MVILIGLNPQHEDTGSKARSKVFKFTRENII